MVHYSCEKCGKQFKQKSHYTKHNNKKLPCINEDNLKKLIAAIVVEVVNETMNKINVAGEKIDLPVIDDIGDIVVAEMTDTDDNVAVADVAVADVAVADVAVADVADVADNIIAKTPVATKHDLGQYFTTNIKLKEKVFEFVLNNPDNVLEPSMGRGDLVEFIQDRINGVIFDMYEIDNDIEMLDTIQKDRIIYGDFMKQDIAKTYRTIVGNPPYVRTKKGNLYIDFTEKCYNLLDNDGELVFVVPSDFLKLTSASKLLNTMMLNGTFTHIYHPHNEKMFENATIDVIVFRYCKNPALEKKVMYNDISMFITNSNGLITFSEVELINAVFIKDYFDIYVGLVSGKEDVYKNDELGNIEVLNAENTFNKYIYIEKYPCEVEKINEYLLEHKKELSERGIRKFNDSNWFEWGAPRNIATIKANIDADCIYIHNLTRKQRVAFAGKVAYFGGGLIMLKPKKECNLPNVVSYLNSDAFKGNFMFSERFKVGHRQLCNSRIPMECL